MQTPASSNPKLPFVHYNLGLACLKKQDYEHAAAQFQQDILIEPDAAISYDKLGAVNGLQQQDEEAIKNFRTALRLDPKLLSSHIGLAKIYIQQRKYRQALRALQSARLFLPVTTYFTICAGRSTQRMGEREKAKAEFEIDTRMINEAREKRGKELSGEIPEPQLTAEPQ